MQTNIYAEIEIIILFMITFIWNNYIVHSTLLLKDDENNENEWEKIYKNIAWHAADKIFVLNLR